MTAPAPSPSILSAADLDRARALERLKVVGAVLGLLLAIVSNIVLLVFASAPLRDLTGNDSGFVARLIYVIAFLLLSGAIAMPMEFYFGFTVPKQFGLLKQELAPWLLDQLKAGAVGMALMVVFLLALYSAFSVFPGLWMPVAVAVITVFMVLIYFLGPVLVRLNHKTAPLDHPELQSRLQALFDKAGVPLLSVSKWLFGEKTKQANAAIVPRGLGQEVLISDTLLERVSIEGIEVVLAHELGHRVHKDIAKGLALAWLQLVLVTVVAYFVLQQFGFAFGLRGPSDIATLPLFFLVFTVLFQLFGLLTNAISRHNEYAADRFALETTGNLAAFEETFQKLAQDNLSDPNPPAWVEFWLHDHPTIAKRIAAARAWAASRASLGRQGA
jgi:STE24 endopeptidase